MSIISTNPGNKQFWELNELLKKRSDRKFFVPVCYRSSARMKNVIHRKKFKSIYINLKTCKTTTLHYMVFVFMVAS